MLAGDAICKDDRRAERNERFLLIDILFEPGRTGRLLNIFCFLGLNGPFDIVLADENLPLTEEKFAGYVNDAFGEDAEDAQTAPDSPILAVMKYYESPLTRQEFFSLHFMGEIPELIDPEEEAGFPEQFRLATLLETPPATGKVQ